ncbi:MAG: class I SAM-dependent methyltransferase [Rhodospirillaceae bacterium]|nr:class I SAM-dependent methyltransferase [Rhodospirillaceae bacterium]
MTDPDLTRQYDAYPYPARDPREEDSRLLEGSPSHLAELIHHLFGGVWPQARPFRALVAGGGTGDALVMLAQHCASAGLDAEITYLDLSAAARAVAEARIARRKLAGVRFATGSLTDLATLAPGPYDYIDCCGVLHHLEDPPAGLKALTAQLAPDGGLGLMVYAPQGRTGVYPLQSALRRLAGPELPDRDRVALARALVGGLPAGNWFRRNPFLGDHQQSDAGLYDLLLHARDRAYTVPELAELVAGAGLAIAGWVPPVRYDPSAVLADGKLTARAQRLDPLAAAALAEELLGSHKTHVVYAAPAARGDTVARPAPDQVPVLREIDGKALAAGFKPGQAITLDLGGHKARAPLPDQSGAIFGLIDGQRSLGAIAQALAAARPNQDPIRLAAQVTELARVLIRFGKLHLARVS